MAIVGILRQFLYCSRELRVFVLGLLNSGTVRKYLQLFVPVVSLYYAFLW